MRRNIGLASLIIIFLTLVVWGISQFIQPILPNNLNSTLILFFVALLAVVAFLAGFKDIVELIRLFSQDSNSRENEFGVLSGVTNSSSNILLQPKEKKSVNQNGEISLDQSSEIRIRMNRSFDDAQVDAFLLDYFPEVYDRLGRGMRKDEKLTLLLNHCRKGKTGFQYLASCLERAEK